MRNARLLIAYLLCTMVVANADANWTKFAQDRSSDEYFDPASVELSDDGLRSGKSLIDFKERLPIGEQGKRFSSVLQTNIVDCAGNRIRITALEYFSGKMGSGEIVHADTATYNWYSVDPTKRYARLVASVCSISQPAKSNESGNIRNNEIDSNRRQATATGGAQAGIASSDTKWEGTAGVLFPSKIQGPKALQGKFVVEIALRKENGKWTVTKSADKEGTEFVRVDPTSGAVALMRTASPGSRDPQSYPLGERVNCSIGVMPAVFAKGKRADSLCDSEFNTISYNAQDAVTDVLGSLAQVVLLSKLIFKTVDADALMKAVHEAGVYDVALAEYSLAREKEFIGDYEAAMATAGSKDLDQFVRKFAFLKNDSHLISARQELMRREFAEASSGRKLLAFVNSHGNDDFENLLTSAREKLALAYKRDFENATTVSKLKEFMETYQQNDYDKLVPLANKKVEVLLKAEAAEEQKRRAAEAAEEKRLFALKQAKMENWRKALAVGDETNCGPVLELRAAMVKIYFPVKDYGNEHWIRRPQLFP